MVDPIKVDLHSTQANKVAPTLRGEGGCVINLSDDRGSTGGFVLFVLLLLFLIAMVVVLAAPGDGFCFEYC